MKKRQVCGVCSEARSPFVMNNKLVCLRCDELLFDIEIECEEEAPEDRAPAGRQAPASITINLKK